MAPRSVASVHSILLSIKLLFLCKHFSYQNFSTILNPYLTSIKYSPWDSPSALFPVYGKVTTFFEAIQD